MTNTIKVKNLQRAGKTVYNSKYGEMVLEVYKQKGGSIFYVKIDGVDKGVHRVYAENAWDWISEYLGVPVEQEDPSATVTPEKVNKRKGQSKWR